MESATGHVPSQRATDVATKRRQYRRASTIAVLPPDIREPIGEEEEEPLLPSKTNAGRCDSAPVDIHPSVSPKKGSGSPNKSEGVSATGASRRQRFQQRRSVTVSTDEPLLPLLDVHYNSGGKKSPISKSPTSPSNIFSKFKERIQQSLFINSNEWPSVAAILQDKRIRANEQAKASLLQEKDLDLQKIQQVELHKSGRRNRTLRVRSDSAAEAGSKPTVVLTRKHSESGAGRLKYMRSDPVVYRPPSLESQEIRAALREAAASSLASSSNSDPPTNCETEAQQKGSSAKEAFRRRSISEDTYDRLPITYVKEMKKLQQTFATHEETLNVADGAEEAAEPSPKMGSSRSMSSGGIICSNDDLMAILNTYQRSRSPSRNLVTEGEDKLQVAAAAPTSSAPPVTTAAAPAAPTPGGLVKVIVHGERSSLFTAGSPTTPEQATTSRQASGAHSAERRESIPPVPPPEIVYDSSGQTWDIYGAEFDPEILGEAIQRHLERMMQGTSQDTSSPEQERRRSHETRHRTHRRHRMHDTVVKTTQPRTFSSWFRYLCPMGREQVDETSF